MTPLERAARAVRLKLGAEFHPESGCWMTDGGLVDGDEFTDIARAMLQAIREPIDDWLTYQIEHGHAPDGYPVEMNEQYGAGRRSAFEATKAMIDAALEEQPPA